MIYSPLIFRKNLCQLTVLKPHKIVQVRGKHNENHQPQEAEKYPDLAFTGVNWASCQQNQQVLNLGIVCISDAPRSPWGSSVRQSSHPVLHLVTSSPDPPWLLQPASRNSQSVLIFSMKLELCIFQWFIITGCIAWVSQGLGAPLASRGWGPGHGGCQTSPSCSCYNEGLSRSLLLRQPEADEPKPWVSVQSCSQPFSYDKQRVSTPSKDTCWSDVALRAIWGAAIMSNVWSQDVRVGWGSELLRWKQIWRLPKT